MNNNEASSSIGDQATRLLDAIERFGGNLDGYFKDDGGWCRLVFNTETQVYDRYGSEEATPTEIKALAWELEGLLSRKGYKPTHHNSQDMWSWATQKLISGVSDVLSIEADRIEALLLAAEKVRDSK